MEELRVPTTSIEAELQLSDGRVLRGTIFVPASTSIHSGSERPDEWINDPSAFFPFRVEGSDAPELFSKHATVRLSVPALPPGDELPADAEQRRVRVECAGGHYDGTVVLDTPSHQRRVLDCLNRPQAFFALTDGDRVHLLRKSAVIRVGELGD